jgi:putative transposase
MSHRLNWIEPETNIPTSRKFQLAHVSHATFYRQKQIKRQEDESTIAKEDILFCRLIDEQYTKRPFYGSRRMVLYVRKQGYSVNRKRVQRLMRTMGLAGMAPGPHTSEPHPEHKVYPYLLRDLAVVRPNHVWSTDLTYIRLAHGFAYLVVMMDWYSRKVLAWRISNTMEAAFCVECYEEAIALYGIPEIMNSDQGSQFTSDCFVDISKKNNVVISMDGRGRAFDNIFVERLWRNVKYEDIYLKGYESLTDLREGLTQYFEFYNAERPHQSLGYSTPNQVYLDKKGGGAIIIDKWKHETKKGKTSAATEKNGNVSCG